jgi:hypothetical protein
MQLFCQYFAPKNFKAKCNKRKAAQFALIQKKRTRKMLMKLTPGRKVLVKLDTGLCSPFPIIVGNIVIGKK